MGREMRDQNLGDESLRIFYKLVTTFKSRFSQDMCMDDVSEIAGLTKREVHVLLLRYESSTKLRMTLEAVATHFDVGRERIRQIICKALRKLRRPSMQKDLKAFLNEEETSD